jgi:hypothetical protein
MIFKKQLALTVIVSSTLPLLTTSFSSADTKYAPLPVKINQQTPYNKA